MAVARQLYRLMACKDEYEVARLYSDGDFRRKLESRFEGNFELRFNLAPPLLSRRDPNTGHLIKREFGPWIMRAFALLARLRFLRGTASIFSATPPSAARSAPTSRSIASCWRHCWRGWMMPTTQRRSSWRACPPSCAVSGMSRIAIASRWRRAGRNCCGSFAVRNPLTW